jgi:hypothetical protein
MDKHSAILAASTAALLAALIGGANAALQKRQFDDHVRASLAISEMYDDTFIGLVKKLEIELATRAEFGYPGGKDPFTGRERKVVTSAPRTQSRRPNAKTAADPFKLTAIIADETGEEITAIVMDGERSYSVGSGDKIADRRVTKITVSEIHMEDAMNHYIYNIKGERKSRKK